MTKKVYIICGGTIVHVAPHLALSAQAKGSVGLKIYDNLRIIEDSVDHDRNVEFVLVPTAMAFYQCYNYIEDDYWALLKSAGLNKLETYTHMKTLIDHLTNLEDTKGIILPAAICDYEPRIIKTIDDSKRVLKSIVESNPGKKASRLETSKGNISLEIKPTEKLVHKIRRRRKDIFLVSFKTLTGKSVEDNYKVGLRSLKDNKSNLVFVNDIHNMYNMIMTPEEYMYSFDRRDSAIVQLSEMIWDRMNLTYHRTVVKGKKRANIKKLAKEGHIPHNFVTVLDNLISSGAYATQEFIDDSKEGSEKFRQLSVGHFGCKVTGKNSYHRISSVRSSNHKEVLVKGAIKILSEDKNLTTVSGGKPSVGEHTQKSIYDELGDNIDSIVHFHCPMKKGSKVNIVSQKPYQCGTYECALNTQKGMREMEYGIYAVHLEGHGPNIAFSKDIDPDKIMNFINENWDVSKKEDGIDAAKDVLGIKKGEI